MEIMKITIHWTWFPVMSVAIPICISNANHLLKMMLEHAASTRNEIKFPKQTLSSLKANGITISYSLYHIDYMAYTVWPIGISYTYVFFQRFYTISFGICKWYDSYRMSFMLWAYKIFKRNLFAIMKLIVMMEAMKKDAENK